MVFSSILFLLFFFPVFLICYYLTPARFKNSIILLFSIFFYAWGAPEFIFVILGTTFLDFYFVRLMCNSDTQIKKKLYLTVSVCINLGLLCYFKYANFFIENVNYFLTSAGFEHIHWVKVILPIGISFYTFETITYVVDTYRGVHKPLTNVWDYQVYIMLFPKLIAGPIIRYHDLADQIEPVNRTEKSTTDEKLIGFYRFAIGLSKKVLIANQIGVFADQMLAKDISLLNSSEAWLGIIAYTFQIYFDFSGYSDMAIGIAKMIGFQFPENFNNPYTATSITDFWRRWHISVSSWMKNYLYIPLGGNKVASKSRLYFNLWLVFLISGLWHGASWNFVIWGVYHGTFLIMERAFLLKVYEKLGKVISISITFVIVAIGWVFFRIENFGPACHFIQKLFEFNFQYVQMDMRTIIVFVTAAFFSFLVAHALGKKIQDFFYFNPYGIPKHITLFLLFALLMIVDISMISAFGFNPFIYFRF
jgi:alginate O-acetyltransferase complex protein AlgI